MSSEYLVNSSDLTAVADSIRAKGGTSGTLAFPDGFVEAVWAIQAGGGSDEVDYLNSVITAQATELHGDWVSLPRYGFYMHRNLKSVNLPNVKTLGDNCFAECAMTSVSMPLVETLPTNCFMNTYALANADMPNLIDVGEKAFFSCALTNIPNSRGIKTMGKQAFQSNDFTEAILPSIVTMADMSLCRTKIVVCDLGENLSTIPINLFYECKSLTTLILRSGALVTLSNINAFYNCGTNINVYVPSALVSAYASATNWSAVTGATLNFLALEGSEYE